MRHPLAGLPEVVWVSGKGPNLGPSVSLVAHGTQDRMVSTWIH